MAKFYGTLEGDRGATTRTGNHRIRTSLQSYDGSVIAELYYNKEGQLAIRIDHSDDSNYYGNSVFNGTVEEFIKKLS